MSGTHVSGKWIQTIDYHTAGEPFRIVRDGLPDLPGETVAERRVHAIANFAGIDELRQLLVNEPRGHADMYGGFIVPADDAGAHFGVLFWHKDGFSTACGHGTIALGVWATDTGLVESDPDGITEVKIDVPSGRVSAFIERSGGRLVRATFRNVESWPIGIVALETSRGPVRCELSYSGAIYASVNAHDVGLSVTPDNYTELIAIGREIKWALNDHKLAQHKDPRLSGVYGTILFDDLGESTLGGPLQRNITVFADGEVDRSPCGSGTGARVALLASSGELPLGKTLEHHSIVGSIFTASWQPGAELNGASDETLAGEPVLVGDKTNIYPHTIATVIPEVSGTAHLTGEHRFYLDPLDPIGLGFTLR